MNNVQYIILTGFPNNRNFGKYLINYFKLNDCMSIILKINPNKIKNSEIIDDLYFQIINNNRYVSDKNMSYHFIFHDWGSIYGRLLIEKYFLNKKYEATFLSLGPNLKKLFIDSIFFDIRLMYQIYLTIVYIIYIFVPFIGKPIANFLQKIFIFIIYLCDPITAKYKHFFEINPQYNYLYYKLYFETSETKQLLNDTSLNLNKTTFIRGNSFDQIFDKNKTANVILNNSSHWFILSELDIKLN